MPVIISTKLWDEAIIKSRYKAIADRYIKDVWEKNNSIYRKVSERVGIPAEVIFAIHYRESDCRFNRHLHNGDPLTDRTVRHPAGRPKTGNPPFTWEESAIDALSLFYYRPKVWDKLGILEFCERYNGVGYRRYDVYSPYVYAGTQYYEKGLFVEEYINNRWVSVFKEDKVDPRPGCLVFFKLLRMFEK